MQRILLFIIDSLNFSRLRDNGKSLMPFLYRLSREGISCENMFSQAPYTEAAVMNIYCGQSVLENGGYLKRFKCAKKTIFEAMKENGYTTYYNSFQPQCFPSSLRSGIEYIYYNVGYDLGALWSYRLYHYALLLSKSEITTEDNNDLIEIFDDNFSEWLLFVENLIKHDESCSMIQDNSKSYCGEAVMQAVKKEYQNYCENKIDYIYEVLRKGKKHNIYKIPAFIQDLKIKNRGIMSSITKLFKPLLKEIRKIDFKYNLKNNKGFVSGVCNNFVGFCKHPSNETYKNFLKSLYIVVNVLFDLDLYQRIGLHLDGFKNAPSARKHIDHYIDWVRNHKEEKHFACIHVDDIHNPEEFFTYDSEDLSLLVKERDDAMKYLGAIDNKYKGSVTHDLSLIFIDNIIKYLFEQLDNTDLLESTTVLITADHGFSYAGYPLRDSLVTNLYLENYRVPFVIVNSGFAPRIIDKICLTKDIPSTICDIALNKKIPEFSGLSVFSEKEYERATIEYCGGGCPDIRRRKLKLASHDSNFLVGALCSLEEDFDWSKITEVYDLINDPLQKNNLVKEYNKVMLVPYFEDLFNRHSELRRENYID